QAIGYDTDPYDPLIDEFEPGMTTAEVETEFADLRRELVPIVEAINEREAPSAELLHQPYDEQKQWDFGLRVIRDFGFDFDRGRQDRSAHPFTIHFSSSDVRITTRVHAEFFSPAFFGTLHEAGHGMYEQGISTEIARTPLAHGTSLGLHESQSRLWENQIGRSRAFWTHYYTELQKVFPRQLGSADIESFYRAVNRVSPSLIRVEADEVTYNLHVMLRFELERALIADDLAIADLPGAWNDKVESYLGLTPPNDSKGVLQDIHWSMGALGYFPTYSLGTLMSTQIYNAALEAIPELPEQVARGDFKTLLGWLQENIYRFGRMYPAQDILLRITGSKLDSSHWLAYIKSKFGGIYGTLV
ncbi:MAG: carboxypeptidase M32, partial [Candidatus Latescibacterota bacterium]